MITVKIPAAIRKHSPVLWTLGPDSTVSGGVVHIHGDGSLSVASRQGGLLYEDDEVPRDAVALIISDPTGAAHLAWWLRSAIARISVSSHAEHLAAAGAGQHYSKFLNAGSVCTAFWGLVESAALGMPVDEAGLALLRDYAHRVAGVTNG